MVDSNDQIYQVKSYFFYTRAIMFTRCHEIDIYDFWLAKNLKKMRRSKIFPENLRKRRINFEIDTFVKIF